MATARPVGRLAEGFTLVEVLFALMLLSISIVSATEILQVGILSERIAKQRTLAHGYLRREVEAQIARPYAEVASVTIAAVPEDASFQVETVVTTPQANLKKIVATITWTGLSNRPSSRSLVAYRANAE
ncbi:MAG: prepilin-type N-terminal cleavage/methylation domain-containing protein [Planctomycetes bacterium]|nr:prepilin-type N-terminal cleavage/methylation domain-containing protein [Planctomycetota bacterium]